MSNDTRVLNYTYNQEDLEKISGLFPNINSLILPISIERDVKEILRYKKNYTLISDDKTLAIEKTLYFLSNLTSTLFTESKWKTLSSTILHEQTKDRGDNTYIYTAIRQLLIDKNIISHNESYQSDVNCMGYRLKDKYLKTMKTSAFLITSKSIISKKNTRFYQTLSTAMYNPICANLIKLYPSIVLPTEKEIKIEAKKLIKENYKTNKGKVLTLRNSHSDDYFKDSNKRSFVEDSIKLFNYLTENGFMIPSEGSEKSGGRIVDSFTLMPSFIRKMITINGERLVEADYSCLHPNIAKTLYNGTTDNISHDTVANYLNIDRQTAKIEHLSYFNKHWNQMEKSSLHKFYMDNEERMMDTIKAEKASKGYKETSKQLFKTEVELMSDVVIRLNDKGINVLYVYDALYCEPKHQEIVTEVMNTVAKESGINTAV